MNKYILAISLLFLECLTVFGTENAHTDFRIVFQRGSIDIDPTLGDNAESLAGMFALFESIASDSGKTLSVVEFSGAASPDGRAAFNKSLASARVAVLERYVRERVQIPDSIVRRRPDGIAWQLLAELVEASDMPHKHEVLNVLHNVPEAVYDRRGRLVDSRKKQLMDLHGGRTWHYMDKHFFGTLRNACTIVIQSRESRAESREDLQSRENRAESREGSAEAGQRPVGLHPGAAATESRESLQSREGSAESREGLQADAPDAPSEDKPFYMALKTNMLFDALALPNLGAEFYLGKGWSISGNWMYGWWDTDKRHRYWRAYGGELALRKWFGPAAARKPLTGHHVGLYGQLLTYDFEFGGEGQMAGEPGKPLWSEPSYAAGIEYGYSLPIGSRLNIDFAVGIGYLGGTYYKYKPIDGHYVWQGTSRRHWFGPTKAEISLVWLLGRGNVNAKKGGAE